MIREFLPVKSIRIMLGKSNVKSSARLVFQAFKISRCQGTFSREILVGLIGDSRGLILQKVEGDL